MVAKVVAPPISSVPMVEPRWEIRKYLSSLVFIQIPPVSQLLYLS